MRYLHYHNIVHLDLKPENILYDKDFYPRVCDFGLSACFPGTFENSINLTMKGEIKTHFYLAPELLNGQSTYNSSADAYSFAILAYSIISGKGAYSELDSLITSSDYVNKILSGYRPQFTDDFSNKMRELISRCWSQNADERPSFDEIFDQLSNDFSYFIETVDSASIQSYIQKLESESNEKEVNDNHSTKDILNELHQLKSKCEKYQTEINALKSSNQ